MGQLMTSLDEIKSFTPCASGWKDILTGQKKTKPDSILFPLVDCLESNSISDVCWLLGKRKTEIQICVRFAKMVADSVSHLRNAAYYAAERAAAYAAYAAERAAYYAAERAAAYAADAAANYAANAAREKQIQKNKEFLRICILEYNQK